MNVDAPLLGIEAEQLEGAPLAEVLRLVDELVAAVVARARVALGVLVCRIKRQPGRRSARGVGPLCMTLPRASRTACEVKFSEGIRLMKCFCRCFSWAPSPSAARRGPLRGASRTNVFDDVEDGRVGLLEVGDEELRARRQRGPQAPGRRGLRTCC